MLEILNSPFLTFVYVCLCFVSFLLKYSDNGTGANSNIRDQIRVKWVPNIDTFEIQHFESVWACMKGGGKCLV